MKLHVPARVVLAALIVAAGVGCGRSRWIQLRSMHDLTSVFERDAGNTRLVLLLSPT